MKSLKIAVLCGSLSTERNISFLTGARVCAALRRRGHRAVLVDLFLGFENGEGMRPAAGSAEESGKAGAETVFDPEYLFDNLPPIPDFRFDGQEPDLLKVRGSRKHRSSAMFGHNVLPFCRAADIVFMALHGKVGEDGRIQASFDMLGIPYTGSGHLGSAVAMDKMLTKMIVGPRGVRTPAFRRWEYDPDAPIDTDADPESSNNPKENFIRSVCRQTDVPCVVKTPDGGSSVGVYIVRHKEDLVQAVRRCLSFGRVFMTEQFIEGRELTCGVLRGRALPSVEIVPKTRFYDYSNKYVAGATEEICPGRVTPRVEQEMGRMALQVHEILRLSTYSRSDFIVDADDQVWFLEVNTLPGMTDTSLVPQEAAAVGISYEDLCEQIVDDALRLRAGH